MKGYKAFKKGMICNPSGNKPFQYQENTVYEQDEGARICERGFHFCKNPLDVLAYYPLVDEDGNMSEFAEVEALDEAKTNDYKKFCTKKIKIGAKLSFPALVQASVNFEFEKSNDKQNITNDNGGDYAKIGSSGDYAKIGSSGSYAQIGSSGSYAQIGSSGSCAKIGSSGSYAQIGSSGSCATIASSGGDSVICCAGRKSRVKAKKGSWITLVEWKYDGIKKRSTPVCVKTEYVDGERIKEDTFYILKDGEFVEVK